MWLRLAVPYTHLPAGDATGTETLSFLALINGRKKGPPSLLRVSELDGCPSLGEGLRPSKTQPAAWSWAGMGLNPSATFISVSLPFHSPIRET